jgi:hypothetical protein
MSRQGCGKYGRPEEIRQMEATRKLEVLNQVSVGRLVFNERNQVEDIQKIIAKNIKVTIIEKSTVSISEEKYLKSDGLVGTKDIEKKNEDRREGLEKRTELYNAGNQNQGDFGEHFCERVAIESLGYMPVEYDKHKHGIDGIYINKEGHFVIAEHKFTTDKNGKGSLDGSLKNNDRELSVDWLKNILIKMTDRKEKGPDSELYSDVNSEVAKEIKKAIDEKTLHRVLIHVHSQTLNVIVSECDDKENVQPFIGYEYIKE